MYTTVLLLGLLGVLQNGVLVSSQLVGAGRCPNVSVVQDFDVSRYTGLWYENRKYFVLFEFGGRCITARYTPGENGTVNVFNSQILAITGTRNSIQGSARFAGPVTEAKLLVKFPSLPIQMEAPYWVLGTDYTTYAVVFSCTDLRVINARSLWVLTREREPPQSVIDTALAVVRSNGLSTAFLMKTSQRNCPDPPN